MRPYPRVAYFIAIFAGAAGFAGSAAAEDALSIEVTASVTERCGISSDSSSAIAATPDLDVATTLRFGFRLDCNAPFRIGVSSRNGALLLDAQSNSENGEDGFSRRKDYDVALDVATDGDPIRTEECAASALTSIGGGCDFYGRDPGEGTSSGQRTAIDRSGAVIVKWQGGGDQTPRRAAGIYRDTITVVVGVRS